MLENRFFSNRLEMSIGKKGNFSHLGAQSETCVVYDESVSNIQTVNMPNVIIQKHVIQK